MVKTEMAKRIVVLGVGNILNRDEGAGVQALKELEKRLPDDWKAKVELLDGGVLGMDLLPYVERATHLLVLDAADFQGRPGAIREFSGGALKTFFSGKISWHQLGFQEVLEVARVRGHYPGQVHLIGVQPGDMEVGLGLSEALELSVRDMARRALDILKNWLEDTDHAE
ncbi:MAG: Hydrogenase maturation protease [Candidatus Saccharicenans subterraneus]|uniref:Hydrogenase maturation protease n=1 Tax=Candidatus Saccharicenans subterraneus TaxID=2508984 RepID=A0A3E2BPE4_9BACT|nr:MAG: Hydrogenase maturation protease [Candidatus Saccharicenans subterraneum]